MKDKDTENYLQYLKVKKEIGGGSIMIKKILFIFIFVISVALFPENKNFRTAVEYHKNGDLKQAEKFYKKAVHENDLKSMYNLSLLYKEQGKDSLAEKYMMMVIESDNVLEILQPGILD